MPRYRVNYRHVRNGVKMEIVVQQPTPGEAETAAARILTQHIQRTAGAVTQWAHTTTVEVERDNA